MKKKQESRSFMLRPSLFIRKVWFKNHRRLHRPARLPIRNRHVFS